MFFVKFLILCLLNVHFRVVCNDISAISTVIDDVINEFLVKDEIKFDIIVLGEKTRKIDEIIDGICMKNGGKYQTMIKWIPDMSKWDYKLS